ncbi:OR6C65 [Branchiostoma lanceolatum]|uniref:OR6C65 protein n=1 Tax=Branchiostoma lanceolatum TaxID=7740 RepID=A0A8K0EM67_BRALA|nr:OR6C65 [Branchiostoma lanceolatum]
MFGTYLLMATDLYHFICNPLHYGSRVTTKRVIIGIVTVRAFALFFGIGPAVIRRLQNSGDSLCQPEPFSSTSPAAIFRNICVVVVVVAVLAILVIYFLVYKEARKQQERDEHRNLWLCQTKAFRTLAPHIIVLVVSVASYLFLVASGRSLLNAGAEKASTSRLITVIVANRIFLTLSSMVNPIIYSFRQPEFRRALRELCDVPNNIPLPSTPPPVHRGPDIAVVNVLPDGHDQWKSDEEELAAESPSQQTERQREEQTRLPGTLQTQAETHGRQTPPTPSKPQTQKVQVEVHNERTKFPDHRIKEKTRPNQPLVQTALAEEHPSPTLLPGRSGL